MTVVSLFEKSRNLVLSRVAGVVPGEQWNDLRHRWGRYHPWETGFDFASPPVRPGEMTGPPDFVGVGVPMAGVSWWFALIAGHPDVTHHAGIAPGRHYLSHFAARSFGPDQVALYHDW